MPSVHNYLIIFNGGDGDISYDYAETEQEAKDIFENHDEEGMNGIFRIDYQTKQVKRVL